MIDLKTRIELLEKALLNTNEIIEKHKKAGVDPSAFHKINLYKAELTERIKKLKAMLKDEDYIRGFNEQIENRRG